MPTISALHLYPIKGARGLSVTSASVDAYGFIDDRRWMVIDAHDRFITQRQIARLALLVPTLTAGDLVLAAAPAAAAPSLAPLPIPRQAADRPTRAVTVWKDTIPADDCGDAAAAWLTAFLGQPCRLVHTGAGARFTRVVTPSRVPGSLTALSAAPSHARTDARGAPQPVSFADAFPFLVVSEASLAELNDRLAAQGHDPLPMDRFRPNLVVRDAPAPFAEDTWSRWRAGDVEFHAAGPCARCIVTTTDQARGERAGREPLRTLASYRRSPVDPSDVHFGQNLIHATKQGRVTVGDTVEILA